MNPEFKKRLKSFIWHTAAMLAVLVGAFLIEPQTVVVLHIPQFVVIGIGLLVAQITKYLNQG